MHQLHNCSSDDADGGAFMTSNDIFSTHDNNLSSFLHLRTLKRNKYCTESRINFPAAIGSPCEFMIREQHFVSIRRSSALCRSTGARSSWSSSFILFQDCAQPSSRGRKGMWGDFGRRTECHPSSGTAAIPAIYYHKG
ncbi:uncharacterized protein LOC124304733 [Neodiprion virginianus]|uniref:uncharacterized protein LOC124304733 n=1 Tax=Neodiprion virginianus TaxID=2961670 RepID=UPI001EE6AF6E|nr:uncharacterized protein LOC124304733 [Neodiprion virginianus]